MYKSNKRILLINNLFTYKQQLSEKQYLQLIMKS